MSSYSVRKHSGGWSVREQIWNEGKSKTVTIPQQAYEPLGINSSWTIERAKERITR